MSNTDRQKIQDGIFEQYRINIDSYQKTRNASVDFREIVKELIKISGFSEKEIYTEKDCLIEMGFFLRHAVWCILATAKGIDKIWGNTSHSSYIKFFEQEEEIVKLAPECWGVGINLKAAWRWLKKGFKK